MKEVVVGCGNKAELRRAAKGPDIWAIGRQLVEGGARSWGEQLLLVQGKLHILQQVDGHS